MKNPSLIDTCYTRKGTREFYRVTTLGALDRPMGLIFCAGDNNYALATYVNILVDQLVEITPKRFNAEWITFCRDLSRVNVPVFLVVKKSNNLHYEGKLRRS